MGTKKNYMNLLKEAISEFDTSKTQSIKGPMLDGILSWNGDGELPTNKDAGSILERYYFNEEQDSEIDTLEEADYENDKGEQGKGMQHAKGDAGPQAGTSDKKTIKATKDEIEDEIAKEMADIEALGDSLIEADDNDDSEDDKNTDDNDSDDNEDSDDEAVKEELEMENAIIEKLIAEMEADDDAQGAGTQQAGTGDADDLVPDRKDEEKTSVKAKSYKEDNELIEAALAELEAEMDEEDEEKDEEKELDIDKKVNEVAGVGSGPIKAKGAMGNAGVGEDEEDLQEDEDAYTEAFNLFKEAIEE